MKEKKVQNLLGAIRTCLEKGQYFDTRHSQARQNERSITRPEITYVLRSGRHEPSKDKYDKKYKAWNYAIKGKTVDKNELRIIVSFDAESMLIITTIKLR